MKTCLVTNCSISTKLHTIESLTTGARLKIFIIYRVAAIDRTCSGDTDSPLPDLAVLGAPDVTNGTNMEETQFQQSTAYDVLGLFVKQLRRGSLRKKIYNSQKKEHSKRQY